uniref:Reverse transcriptase Ty1/copia-type domain-containing protein n=1 Tax=Solanum lycopersicum TaxID=4081 RepID=A0A3Q7EGE7_SOLLC
MLINRRQGFRGKKLLDIACEHCGYKNHLSKDCYRLIGYPADFKSKRKQGLHPSPGGNNNGYRSNNLTQNSAQNSNTQNAGTSFRPYANYAANERQSDFQLTEEEYNHVQNLRINSTLSAARDEGEYKANLAGNVSITSTPASKFSAHTWIIDSGATHHVAFSKDVLADDGSYNQRSSTVQLPTGNKAHITGTGNSIVDITFEEKCFPFKSDKVAETSIPSAPDSYNCNEDHPLTIQAIPADYDPSNVSSPSEVENNIIMPDSEDIFLGDEECTNADISPPIPPIVVTSNNPIARPNRSVKPPIWHKDYLMSTTSKQAHNTCLYPISDYVDYSNLNGSYKVFLTSLSNVDEPHTFKEASTNDLLLTGNSHQLIQELKDSLHSRFKMKNLGDLKYFLGIEILRSKTGILLNQRKYALELISDTGLSGAKPANTPLEANIKLTTVEHDELLGVTDDSVLKDVTSYQRLVGRLLYLTITRPDISFAVQVLSQFMQQPKVSHWEEALRLVRYIKRSPGQGILLSSKRCLQLEAFCDADWVACSKTRRSVTGYMVKLGDSLIS